MCKNDVCSTCLSVSEWEAATKDLYDRAEDVINESAVLRSVVDNHVLGESAKKLRDQADAVDIALARFISDTQQVGQCIENDLRQVTKTIPRYLLVSIFFFFVKILCTSIVVCVHRKIIKLNLINTDHNLLTGLVNCSFFNFLIKSMTFPINSIRHNQLTCTLHKLRTTCFNESSSKVNFFLFLNPLKKVILELTFTNPN